MKRMAFLLLLISTCAFAQNPVADALRTRLERTAKNTIAAAETMPADKYAYKPTDAEVPFGHWVSHAAGANYALCSALTGGTAPQSGVKETDSKDKLIEALKKSFDYCTEQMPKFKDSQLGDQITIFHDMKVSKGGAALELSADWADHYAHMASYLRLNGLLPPTAKKP